MCVSVDITYCILQESSTLQVQMGLLVLLIAAQVDFVVGTFMGPMDDKERARGFVGLESMYCIFKLLAI